MAKHFKERLDTVNPKHIQAISLLVALVGCIGMALVCRGRLVDAGMTSQKLLIPIGLATASVLAIGIILLLSNQREKLAQGVFPVLLLIFGMAYGLLLPPGTVPDEYLHITHAYEWSMLLEGRSVSEMWADDFEASQEVFDSTVTLEKEKDFLSRPLLTAGENGNDEEIIQREGIQLSLGSSPPQLRLPSALGMLLARRIGFAPMAVFYFGRLFNLLYAVVLLSLAVFITPACKGIIMTLSFLPMTMQLISSASYDAGIIALVFLLSAVILRIWFGDERAGVREVAALLIMSALVAPCKVVYSLVCLVVLFIPGDRFGSRRFELVAKIGAPFVALISIAALRSADLLRIAAVSESSSALSLRETLVQRRYYSLGDVMGDPLGFAIMFVRTIYQKGLDWLWMFVGHNLAHFQGNLRAPDYLIHAFLVLMLFAAMGAEDDQALPSRPGRLALVGISCLVVLAVMGSMLLGWTFVGDQVIDGVQGRYFIPVGVMTLLALRCRHLRFPVPTLSSVLFWSVALSACYLMHLYTSVVLS